MTDLEDLRRADGSIDARMIGEGRVETNESVGKCERCGCRTNNVRYCADCQTHVERMRARR